MVTGTSTRVQHGEIQVGAKKVNNDSEMVPITVVRVISCCGHSRSASAVAAGWEMMTNTNDDVDNNNNESILPCNKNDNINNQQKQPMKRINNDETKTPTTMPTAMTMPQNDNAKNDNAKNDSNNNANDNDK